MKIINLSCALIFLLFLQSCKKSKDINITTVRSVPGHVDRFAFELKIGVDKNGFYWIEDKRINKNDLEEILIKQYPPKGKPPHNIAIQADKLANVKDLLFLASILDKNGYNYGIDVAVDKVVKYKYELMNSDYKKDFATLFLNLDGNKTTLHLKEETKTKEYNIPIKKLTSILENMHNNNQNVLIIIQGNGTCQELIDVLEKCYSSWNSVRLKYQ